VCGGTLVANKGTQGFTRSWRWRYYDSIGRFLVGTITTKLIFRLALEGQNPRSKVTATHVVVFESVDGLYLWDEGVLFWNMEQEPNLPPLVEVVASLPALSMSV
jgi:hypothetical protein